MDELILIRSNLVVDEFLVLCSPLFDRFNLLIESASSCAFPSASGQITSSFNT